MTDAFDTAFETVQGLVADFRDNEPYYLSPKYPEARVRQDFIDKFFTALGWDVLHERQKNPYEQEVKVERGVRDELSKRRADYAFFIAPNFRDVRFFAEAKKPARQIENADDYFQTLRYGWNSGTPLAVLTDFEHFHVLDCRYKPDIRTALDRAVPKLKFHYSHYADSEPFARLYWLFSREAVAGGKLANFAESLPRRRGQARQRGLFKAGAQDIDDAFLQELDGYRETLAKAFKKHNPALDGATLTEITQRTLDRLVFLRFLEDKLIETGVRVADFGNGGSAWRDFIAASGRLDGIYNGIIFKRHGLLDARGFEVDEDAFSDICDALSHDQSPYDFDIIPIHILGSIYERFLGKVIVATARQARVEAKPEVRKAGGVYYTPDYIVRYIVEQTVGKLIAGKTPAQIARLRFADIACGSGSFLLGIFDCLLLRHLEWYTKNPGKAKNGEWIDASDGTFRLSLVKKREILLNNIYGVDIDAQAVEVAQLSLYLKLLEEETPSSARNHQLEIREALLPPLNKNIVCGNALIGWDILDGQLFERDEERKLNPMNFESVFPEIMKNGGFDAIVGNPPYVRQEGLSATKHYFRKRYEGFAGTADLYSYFMERGVKLLRPGGRYSIIVSSSVLRAAYGATLRDTLKKNAAVLRLVDFGGHAIFADAKDTYVCIPVLARTDQPARIEISKVGGLAPEQIETEMGKTDYTVPETRFLRTAWSLKSDAETALFDKLMSAGEPLGQYVKGNFFRGITSGLNKAFVIDTFTRDRLLREDHHSREIIHPVRGGEDIRDYYIRASERHIIFTRRGIDIDDYPAIKNYLEQFKIDLKPKKSSADKHGRKPGSYRWYEIQDDVAYYEIFDRPKLVFPDICKCPRFCYDDTGLYLTNTAYVLGTGDKYLLGLLNSRVFWFAIGNISIPFGVRAGEFRYRLIYQYMEQAPIRALDAGDPRRGRMGEWVDRMLDAKKAFAAAVTDGDRNFYERRCRDLDRQIDALVYALYGLTEKEIRIVEGIE